MREAHEQSRIAKRLTKLVLSPHSTTTVDQLKIRSYDDYTQFRLHTSEAFGVDLQLYKEKLLYTSYEDREPICMIVEDPALYRMHRQVFDTLWNTSDDATLISYQH